MERLLNINELAEILNVDKSWIYLRCRRKEIPHAKIGKYVRFSEREILAFLDGKKQPVEI